MKVKKENGKYYVNDLDLEEVLANRKHIMSWLNRETCLIECLLKGGSIKPEVKLVYKTRLKALNDVRKELKLRK
jgi:hypothetical protein